MLTNSSRSRSLRIALLAIAALTTFLVLTGDAVAAAKSCQPKGTKALWSQGSATVYYRSEPSSGQTLQEGAVPSVCSSKFTRRYKLQPRSDKGSYFFGDYHWNGRYLYFTTSGIYPLYSGPESPALIDLKTGLTTLKLPEEQPVTRPEGAIETPKTVVCGGGYYGCWSGATRVALGSNRSFAISSSYSPSGPGPATPPRGEITLYCVNQSFTRLTAGVIDDELTVGESYTLKRDGNRATWLSKGVRRSVKFC
ncbi:MAG: hypothetical protein HYX29_00335 [Solirubrobacterales bacterium]|nr:hypothetical protein [Solirubrobacterales bacterium]